MEAGEKEKDGAKRVEWVRKEEGRITKVADSSKHLWFYVYV